MTIKPFANMPKETFHLPMEFAIIIPSTTDKSKTISSSLFSARTKEARKKLSSWFGGYTSVKGVGGFLLKDKVVKERVNIVYAYSTRKDWSKNRLKLKQWMIKKRFSGA